MFKIITNPIALGPVAIECPHGYDVCPMCDGLCDTCGCTPHCLAVHPKLCACECHRKIVGKPCECKIPVKAWKNGATQCSVCHVWTLNSDTHCTNCFVAFARI